LPHIITAILFKIPKLLLSIYQIELKPINFLFQNFSIEHFPLPLPSQKITFRGMHNWEVHYKAVFGAIASVAQLARAADL
jgi:hypothetical protein